MNAELKTIEEVVADAIRGIDFASNDYLAERMAKNPKLVLLDVRTADEYQAGHIKGAEWMERGIVEFRMARMIRDPDAEIIVYCKKGNRSGLVLKALKEMGYTNVRAHVGFDEWVKSGRTFQNYLGESRMEQLREINATTNAPQR